jgi:hypothetical protein
MYRFRLAFGTYCDRHNINNPRWLLESHGKIKLYMHICFQHAKKILISQVWEDAQALEALEVVVRYTVRNKKNCLKL